VWALPRRPGRGLSKEVNVCLMVANIGARDPREHALCQTQFESPPSGSFCVHRALLRGGMGGERNGDVHGPTVWVPPGVPPYVSRRAGRSATTQRRARWRVKNLNYPSSPPHPFAHFPKVSAWRSANVQMTLRAKVEVYDIISFLFSFGHFCDATYTRERTRHTLHHGRRREGQPVRLEPAPACVDVRPAARVPPRHCAVRQVRHGHAGPGHECACPQGNPRFAGLCSPCTLNPINRSHTP
jgi:hypothetical protein